MPRPWRTAAPSWCVTSGDTVATETFSREETSIHGTLASNNFKHTFHRYTAVVAPDASVPMIDITVREDADSGRIKARLLQRARIIFREDSAAAWSSGRRSRPRSWAPSRAIPYLNMSFALLEQAVRRSGRSREAGSVLQSGRWSDGEWDPYTGGKDSLALAIGDVEFRLKVIPTVACWAARYRRGRAQVPH